MIGSDKEFEKQCEEYLSYLYSLARRLYPDCLDTDSLVQETLAALIVKIRKGEKVEYPKGFLTAVLKNQYNGWLREKYKRDIVEYSDTTFCDTDIVPGDKEKKEYLTEEYASVRREIGRLIRIYREVTVRHYVHGQTVEQIARELGIPRGTVLSRLSSARNQIKEGLDTMEKYAQISYEPKSVAIEIWGNTGLAGEPLSLIRSDIESNILILAYENPVSVRGIADTMGMPSAYIEPIIDTLVRGELMGRTASGLVYTRCFMQRYEDAFGDIPAQEKLAKEYAVQVWEIVWKYFEPLTKRELFSKMSEKQKATLLLFFMNQMLSEIVHKCRPDIGIEALQLPERPNAGRWLATGTVFENGKYRDNRYDGSGPVYVAYSKECDGNVDCQMFDCQSLFGEAHWAYGNLKYNCSLQSILRFYASFLPCEVKNENELLYELIPEFEQLNILKREASGEIVLDIPALPFEEAKEYWEPVCETIKKELYKLLSGEIKLLWCKRKNRVPKHVDESALFLHAGAASAYVKAQLVEIVERKLMPYPVIIGKIPLIYITYRRREEM